MSRGVLVKMRVTMHVYKSDIKMVSMFIWGKGRCHGKKLLPINIIFGTFISIFGTKCAPISLGLILVNESNVE